MPVLNATLDIASTAPAPAQRTPRPERTSPDHFAALVDSNVAGPASAPPVPASDPRPLGKTNDRARPLPSDPAQPTRPQTSGNDPQSVSNDGSIRPAGDDGSASASSKPGKDAKASKPGEAKPSDDGKSADGKDGLGSSVADPAQPADAASDAAVPADETPIAVAAVPVAPVDPTLAVNAGPQTGATEATATAVPNSGPLTIAAAAALKAQSAVTDLAAPAQPTSAELPADVVAPPASPFVASNTAVTTGLVTADPKLAAQAPGGPAEITTDADPTPKIDTTVAGTPSATAPAPQHAASAKPDGDQTKADDAAAAAIDPAAAQPRPAAEAHPRHAEAQALATSDPGLQQPQLHAAQPPQTTTLTQQTAAAPQLTAALATNVPVAVQDLAVTIAARSNAGASRFEIRLDPAELGRIDVRIEVDRHGQVTSHLTVEKPETLAMLRQDQPQLQRALDNAGLKTGDSGLQFSLRDQSSSGQQGQQQDSGRHAQRLVIRDEELPAVATAGRSYGRTLGASGGVDISI